MSGLILPDGVIDINIERYKKKRTKNIKMRMPSV